MESKPVKARSFGASLVSTLFHGALIGISVIATANAGAEPEEEAVQKIDFVDVKKDEPPPPTDEPPPEELLAPPPPKGFQVLAAPVNIPDVIPEIDLSKALTNEDDFSGKGVAGGLASGVVGGTGVVNQDQTYFDFQVEKPAASLPGSPGPRYPDILRAGGVEGTVLAQFEVDTTGRVNIPSFRVLRSDHAMFEQSLRSALPNLRYLPAEIGGRKVKQLVQQAFTFALQR